MTRKGRAAVFLDRDGTLNREVHYLHRPEDLVWVPGAREAVKKLNDAGLLVVVVTNQAGVAKGHYPESAVDVLHQVMSDELVRLGARIDGWYYCPFHPEGTVPEYRLQSANRKPGPGMLEQAANEFSLDLARCFLVGDRNTDIIAGKSKGLQTWLVQTGYGMEEAVDSAADHIVPSIVEAVDQILEIWNTIR